MSLKHRIEAFRELLVRYGQVTAHFWRYRQDMRSGLFTEDEAEFLPAALSLQEKPMSSRIRWSGRVLTALLLCALLWSIFGQVDVIVNAPGKIIPHARVKSIASVEVASVRAIHVVDGQHVKAGDVLIELDASTADAERNKAQNEELSAALQMARAQAMLVSIDHAATPRLAVPSKRQAPLIAIEIWQAEQQHVEGQYRDYATRLLRIDGEIARLRLALPLAQEQEAAYRALDADHDVAHHAMLAKQQARVELEGQLADAQHQRAALIADTRKQALDQISEAKRLAVGAQQDAYRLDSHSRLLKLTAPVDGIVQQLSVHTVGGVVPAAQPLLQIVPQENLLEVEAQVDNKDIGFVHSGHVAQVKIDAFEYSKYGTVPGQVSQVGADAIQDEKRGLVYTARVALSRTALRIDGNTTQLTPGMTVMVDIKTGRRRIIEYVLSPLIRHQQEALHER